MLPETEKSSNLNREKMTLALMFGIYCKKVHKYNKELCGECQSLIDFAFARLDIYPWGEKKPAYSNCTIHCNPGTERERIREVMRFSGPRMLIYHPIIAFRLLEKNLRENSS